MKILGIIVYILIFNFSFFKVSDYSLNKKIDIQSIIQSNAITIEDVQEKNETSSTTNKDSNLVVNNTSKNNNDSKNNTQTNSTTKSSNETKPKTETQQQVKETTQPQQPEVKPSSTPQVTRCTNNNNHGMDVGNSNMWFDTKADGIAYYKEKIKYWGDWLSNSATKSEEEYQADQEIYDKNCPYGYEAWNCMYCGKWTLNFYYRK